MGAGPVGLTAALCEDVCRRDPWTTGAMGVAHLASWLAHCSRAFHGDLEMMLVLVAVAQVDLEQTRPPEEGRALPRSGISASQLAEVTGIPRETVRRKLEAMAGRGWLERRDDHGWRLARGEGSSQVRRDLADLEDKSLHCIAEFVAGFVAIAGRHVPGLAGSRAPG